MFVRVSGVQVSGLERLRALFYKPSDRFVLVNGRRFRLVEGTAGDGLPLLASPGYDYSQPYSFAAGAKTIAVQKQGQGATRSRPIRFDFYVQRFSERVQPR